MKSAKLLSLLLFVLTACNWAAVDPQKAQAVAQNLMNDMKSSDYSRLDTYYTASFNESEPLEMKKEKFLKLKASMGDIKSFELVDSKEDKSTDNGGPKLQLKYKMHCTHTDVTHTVVIINDEGTHKIAFENFEN